jgi:hypothetical protein
MRTLAVAAIVATFVIAAGGRAEAQVSSCGAAYNRNLSWQYRTSRSVESFTSTKRDIVLLCSIIVRVETWLDQHPSAGVASADDAFFAEVQRIIPVPAYGRWWTYSKHWQIVFPYTWIYNGTEKSFADVVFQSAKITGEGECIVSGGYWDGMKCIWENTPIIADTNHDGYHLTSARDGVQFDLDADGVPEQVAWTAAGSDDCFLAMDRNRNGRIDDGRELFGDRSPAFADDDINTADGFEALKSLENPAFGVSQADSVMDGRDAPFSQLLFWCDANHNGLSEADELKPASSLGLLGINAKDVKFSGRRDEHGNRFRLRARALWPDGERYIYDIWLARR